MKLLRIQLEDQGAWFRPGAALTGNVEWALEDEATRIEIRLLWYTQGRGSRDVGVVKREVIEYPGRMGHQSFEWKAPEAPYSFEGRLITLNWVVEAAVDPGDLVEQAPLVISPFPIPIHLGSPAEEDVG